MKKLALFLCFLLFLTSFCSCSRLNGGSQNNTLPPVDFTPDEDILNDKNTNNDSDGNIDDNEDPVSPFGPYGEVADESHQAFYDRAFRMYSWMEIGTSTLQLDVQDTIEMEGVPYFKVVDPLFDTLDKLQSELSVLFSDEICQQITEAVFIEREGSLYAPDMARGADITVLDEELHLTEDTDDKRVYTMVVLRDTDMDGVGDETETYVYEAENIGGRFKFTVFPFYK